VIIINQKEMIIIIATKVMEWIPTKLNWWMEPGGFNCKPEEADSWTFEYPGGVKYRGKEYCSHSLFNPFYNLEDAFKIVEHLRKKGYSLMLLSSENKEKPYMCQFIKNDLQFFKEGKTSTEAISLAAIEITKKIIGVI
jgi:hypothetical protein